MSWSWNSWDWWHGWWLTIDQFGSPPALDTVPTNKSVASNVKTFRNWQKTNYGDSLIPYKTWAQQWKLWVVKVAASCYITTKIVARMNKSIRNIHVVIIILGLKYQHTLFIDSKKWTKVPPECRTFSSSQKCCAECDKLTTCITTTIRFCHVSNFSTLPTLIYVSSLQICAL